MAFLDFPIVGLKIFVTKRSKEVNIGGTTYRQGNIHNHLANCVEATKISGITHSDVLFRFFWGDFFLIDRKLINYAWLLINFRMV